MLGPRPILHHQHSHPQLIEGYMHSNVDYADFPPAGLYDEYDDGQEVLSRQRLTKEQIEVLESQFQAHPKPNTNIKRQLANQTKLALPRVSNWFQNRRAKAKQQKKQEEFESLQAAAQKEQEGDEKTKASHPFRESSTINKSQPIETVEKKPEARAHSTVEQSTSTAVQQTPDSAQSLAMERSSSTQEASWASLQRALASAEAARVQQHPLDDSFCGISSLESPPQLSELNSSNESSQFPSSTFSEWTQSSTDWAPPAQSDDQIDYRGLNIQQTFSSANPFGTSEQHVVFQPSSEHGSQSSSEDWIGNLQTPTLGATNSQILNDAPLPMPSYPQSRRGSSDEVTAGMGNIGLTTPTNMLAPAADIFPKSEGTIDIAGRRKKPRPAMLGTAALRSRSYGAPTMSPTIRYASSPVHSLRHVKSTGNNLNVHYGGIRKPSSTQRSPLNISTFAEAEAFHAMMAGSQYPTTTVPAPHTSLSPEDHTGLPIPSTIDEHPGFTNDFYQLEPRPVGNMASPPATPLEAEYYPHQQSGSMAPPISAPPQYAVFPDYTPPYSAGPLTTGSWSDAPLTSPDHPTFGRAINMPQPPYITPMIHEYGNVTNFSHPFMTSPSDFKADGHGPATEFYIQEFPQQKENHAHAAQQLAQQKPKNYVFANATANDFSE